MWCLWTGHCSLGSILTSLSGSLGWQYCAVELSYPNEGAYLPPVAEGMEGADLVSSRGRSRDWDEQVNQFACDMVIHGARIHFTVGEPSLRATEPLTVAKSHGL